MTTRDEAAAIASQKKYLEGRIEFHQKGTGLCKDCGIVDILQHEVWRLEHPNTARISKRQIATFVGIGSGIGSVLAPIIQAWLASPHK